MTRPRILMSLLAAAAFTFTGAHAHAQAGRCSNNNINAAFNAALHRAPNGAGNTGECNPANYGGGSWSNQNDLVRRVGAAAYCSNNPWVGQIYLYEFNRYPNWSECTANYGYAPTYMGLDNAIKNFVRNQAQVVRAPQGEYLVTSTGALVDSNGNVVAAANTYVINAGGANVINAGGANVTFPQPGMVINAGGANVAAQRTVMSGGKRVITASIVRR